MSDVTAPSVGEEYEALLQFLYLAPVGLVQIRQSGSILMLNPLCALLLMPISPDGGLENLFDVLQDVAPDLRHRARTFEQSYGMICHDVHLYVEVPNAGRKDAQILSLSLLKLDVDRMMGVLSDVTAAVRRERELKQSQAWVQALITGSTDYALVPLDAHGHCLAWNPEIGRVTGFLPEAMSGCSYSMFYPPELTSAERALDRLGEADDSGWSLDEGWRLCADGTRFWGSCLIAPAPAENNMPSACAYTLVIRDVSDRREASDAARRAIACDHLTGLANRRVLFEEANTQLQRWHGCPRPLSVILVDADHFKQINDRFGHAAGDAVLRHLAAGLTLTFCAIDLIARIGGEEFVVLLPGVTVEAAENLANLLCRTVGSQTVEVGNEMIRYTISAGVAAMDADVPDVDSFLARADIAMYAAKAAGRNRVVRWTSDMQLRKEHSGLTDVAVYEG